MLILVVQLALASAFTGIIWYAQIDQYPMLSLVGKDELPTYQKAYDRRTLAPATAILVADAISGLLLVWIHPVHFPIWAAWVNAGLIVVVWTITWGGCVEVTGTRFFLCMQGLLNQLGCRGALLSKHALGG